MIEHEGKPLDRKAAVTMQRALADTAHRVTQTRLLDGRGVPEVTVEVTSLTADEGP